MSVVNDHKQMIAQVVERLGPELTKDVAFVGGCTTGLLLGDAFALEGVRHTDDVDLIVHVVGRGGWHQLQQRLRERGFRDDMDDDSPICAMRCGDLRVDFMPDDAAILGFSNRWYRDALASAIDYAITEDVTIRLVSPEYFIATKLEAYLGRGNSDPLGSRDIEDLLTIIDGRPQIMDELAKSSAPLREYVRATVASLLKEDDFDYAIQSSARGDSKRHDLILERLQSLANGKLDAR
jgi:predicted nucleotidyltransferase